MTLKQIQECKESIFSKSLYAGMIVFRCAVTNKLEERHIYADDNAEIMLWLDDKVEFYTNHNIKFIAYLNNSVYKYGGLEITKEDHKND